MSDSTTSKLLDLLRLLREARAAIERLKRENAELRRRLGEIER